MIYAVELDTGAVVQRFGDSGGPPVPATGEAFARVVALPRRMGPHDYYDWAGGEIVTDTAALIAAGEAAIDADHDVAAIHARKAMEARAYAASGFADASLCPLLAAEADHLDLDLAALADEVIAHDDATVAAELARREAKVALRASVEGGA